MNGISRISSLFSLSQPLVLMDSRNMHSVSCQIIILPYTSEPLKGVFSIS